MRENFKKALSNIVRHGDTDIFPFPFERYLFEEKLNESLEILESYHRKIEEAISLSPPLTLVKLSQVGYYGVYSGETDHPIPWQTDHLKGWRTVVSNAIEL